MPLTRNSRNKLSPRKRRELDLKISFMEGLVRRDPGYVEALQLLGDHYTQRGRVAESLKVDRRISRLEPDNPLAFYNLACSLTLNDQCSRAVVALTRAIQLGFRNFRWLTRDPDLRKLRKHPGFKQIEAQMKRVRAQSR